jgi:hypothetical protein
LGGSDTKLLRTDEGSDYTCSGEELPQQQGRDKRELRRRDLT